MATYKNSLRPLTGYVLSAFLLVGISNQVQAQIPDIFRWTGGNAITPAAGYARGNALTLTWGFAPDGTSIPVGFGPSGNSNLIARMDEIYNTSGGSDLTQRSWFSLYQSVFDRWSSISGLSYIYEPNDDGVAFSNFNTENTRGILGTRADIRIGGRPIDGNFGILAFNSFPNIGNMVIDTDDIFYNDTSQNSIRLRNVVAHEHGHGIGMVHIDSDDSSHLMNPTYSGSFDGPQYHDILMAHRGYGDFNQKSFGGLGNGVASRATDLGVINDGGTISIGDSARTFIVEPDATDFVSIHSQSDIDFYSFTVDIAGHIDILLEALGFTYMAGPQNDTQIEFDTSIRSDLALALFDTDGSTLLSFVDDTSFGGSELISNFFLESAGTYFVRVMASTTLIRSLSTRNSMVFRLASPRFQSRRRPCCWSLRCWELVAEEREQTTRAT